jgi:hypothetical protein
MTQFKVGQKWRTRGGDVRKIEEIRVGGNGFGGEYGLYLDDKTHRYFDGSYYDDEMDAEDLVFLIEAAPEDDLHPCLERVEKLTIKEGEYGRFFVGKRHSGGVCVWVENSGCPLTEEDFAEAAGLFTALAKATGEPT